MDESTTHQWGDPPAGFRVAADQMEGASSDELKAVLLQSPPVLQPPGPAAKAAASELLVGIASENKEVARQLRQDRLSKRLIAIGRSTSLTEDLQRHMSATWRAFRPIERDAYRSAAEFLERLGPTCRTLTTELDLDDFRRVKTNSPLPAESKSLLDVITDLYGDRVEVVLGLAARVYRQLAQARKAYRPPAGFAKDAAPFKSRSYIKPPQKHKNRTGGRSAYG